MRPGLRLVALGIAAAAALAACSAGATPSPVVTPTPSLAGSPSPSPATYGSPSPSAAASQAAAAAVMVADSKLGKILVDGQGRTLYAFTKDSGGSSSCYDACADNWPALTAGSVTPGTGLDESDFGTTTRTDGTTQITFYGMPLYYFGGDKAAGDTNGQGISSVWFVIAPTGQVIKS